MTSQNSERSWRDAPRTRQIPSLPERTTPMKHFTKGRTATVAVAACAAVAMTGGVAYAFWSTTGSGSGSAAARSFVAPTIAAGAAPAGTLLYPGLTANGTTAGGDLSLKISNTNPFPVTITGITAGTGNVTSDKGTSCADGGLAANATGVSVITKASGLSGTNLTIPASTNNVAVTISQVVSMSTASGDGCQGATFTFPTTGVTLTFSS